jgi:hypothetical protein
MPKVHEIRHIDELAAIGAQWMQLLQQTPGASIFQSLQWLEIYWRHFGDGQQLRVMLVEGADHCLTGIVPLVVRREKTRAGSLRFLTYPLDDWGSFFGPIGPQPENALAAALEHVRRTKPDWDAIELRWLGGPESDVGNIRRAMLSAGFQAYCTLWGETAVVQLDGTWEQYFDGRPRAWRRNLRSTQAKLHTRHRVEFVRYRPPVQEGVEADPRWDLYEACEQIAARSWQGSARDGTTLTHPSVRAFLREVHQAAARLGAADMNLLLLDGQPAAFLYNYAWRGYVYGLRAGYDPGFSRQGVGTVLLAESIRDSFSRGDRWYDLGVGSLRVKRHVQTALLPIYRCSHYRLLSVRAQLIRLRRAVEALELAGPKPAAQSP